jgi:hypothetical protein
VSRVEDEELRRATGMGRHQICLVADLHLAGTAVDLHLPLQQREGNRVGTSLEMHRAIVGHSAADHHVEEAR